MKRLGLLAVAFAAAMSSYANAADNDQIVVIDGMPLIWHGGATYYRSLDAPRFPMTSEAPAPVERKVERKRPNRCQ